MITVLFLLPILLLSALLTYFCFDLVKNYSSAQGLCRDHVLRAQKEMGFSLAQLMSLNPQARFLRKQETEIKLKMAASSANPPALAHWAALLAKNQTQQMALRLKQQEIIAMGELKARMILASLHSHLQSDFSAPKICVEKKPPLAVVPDYSPASFFEKCQTVKVHWQAQAIREIFHQMISNIPRIQNGTCSATLKKGVKVWNPQINEAKFSLNSL
jgi:hypothetical protein